MAGGLKRKDASGGGERSRVQLLAYVSIAYYLSEIMVIFYHVALMGLSTP